MPNIRSAKKQLRQNVVRKRRNLAIKRALRTQVRKVREATAAGEIDRAESEFRVAVKKLDRAGAKNIIHRNAASRLKSRLSAGIKSAKSGRTARG